MIEYYFAISRLLFFCARCPPVGGTCPPVPHGAGAYAQLASLYWTRWPINAGRRKIAVAIKIMFIHVLPGVGAEACYSRDVHIFHTRFTCESIAEGLACTRLRPRRRQIYQQATYCGAGLAIYRPNDQAHRWVNIVYGEKVKNPRQNRSMAAFVYRLWATYNK